MATFAKVAIESPLPQLDRLFDYQVPAALEAELRVGQRVSVPFGKSTKLIDGFVVELADSIDYQGKVSELQGIVSTNVVLPNSIYRTIRAVADRQAVSFGDVAKAAIPSRAVRVEKTWLPTGRPIIAERSEPKLCALICEPRISSRDYGAARLESLGWVHDALDLALDAITNGGSAIICVPDFRDIDLVIAAGKELGLDHLINRLGSDRSKTERYESHLNATQALPQIVVGSRSALFAPLPNLLQIILWDDEDPSHYDQSSPYVSSREVALIRQTIDNCSLAFLSHSRSVAVQRLVAIGYLEEATESWIKPIVAFSDKDVRVDSLAFSTLRSGLGHGPVLVQVSNLGTAKSAYCKSCSSRALCRFCSGPVWIDERHNVRCRWCNAFNTAYQCQQCQGNELRMGRAGSTRTAAELGKAFPGFKVVEATGESVVTNVSTGPQIVISTPGAEPLAAGGYHAVVILDCDVALGRDTLHAREDAFRHWANAIALGAPHSKNALIGLGSELGTTFATWSLVGFAEGELAERSKLGFPPINRLLSATGERAKLELLLATLTQIEGVSKLGLAPIHSSSEWRALVRFSYASGKTVADAVRTFQLKNSSVARVNQNSGRAQRAVSIKIDDPRVL